MTYPANSRCFGLGTRELELPDGTRRVYLQRRFVPPPERFVELRRHTLTEGDRLDNLASRDLGDPEQYWRICDANRAVDPFGLEREIGRRLRITLPEGIPGAPIV